MSWFFYLSCNYFILWDLNGVTHFLLAFGEQEERFERATALSIL
jgi:hypothetical protein